MERGHLGDDARGTVSADPLEEAEAALESMENNTPAGCRRTNNGKGAMNDGRERHSQLDAGDDGAHPLDLDHILQMLCVHRVPSFFTYDISL